MPSNFIERLEKLQEQHGHVGFSVVAIDDDPLEWSVGVEFGAEATDSPMVGGAAYAMGHDLSVAVNSALEEAGV